MPFKCVSCELTFDTAEQFMNHKRAHQEQPEKKGLRCLKCGAPIPVDSSMANYRGEILCPNCGQKLKVKLEDGEVLFASMSQD